MLQFFSDTDTDLTPEIAARYNCRLISMPYAIDGHTVYPYADGGSFDFHAFYDRLRDGVLPNTSALSKEQYVQYFEPVFARGDDILYAHFSRAMTATFDSMDQAVAELRRKYPERKFYEIDTTGITTISYTIVRTVGDLLNAGKTAEEVVAWAGTEVDKFAMYFFADDLKFFKHSGRVSGLAGTEGKMVSVGKEKGRQKAVDRLISYVEELGDQVAAHRICIGHTDAPEIAEQVAAALKARFGDGLEPEIVCVNPTAGAHCGPNGVGVCFHAVHR